jgi:hypothetical protein
MHKITLSSISSPSGQVSSEFSVSGAQLTYRNNFTGGINMATSMCSPDVVIRIRVDLLKQQTTGFILYCQQRTCLQVGLTQLCKLLILYLQSHELWTTDYELIGVRFSTGQDFSLGHNVHIIFE